MLVVCFQLFTAKISTLLRSALLLKKLPDALGSTTKKRGLGWPTQNPDRNPQASATPAGLLVGLWGLLLAIPVVIYYYTIYVNAYNFPYEDDFNSALSFIDAFTFGGLSAWDKLKLVFSQYNEHRIVFDRLVFLVDYWLFGNLNFRHLILIGNVSLLLICILFGRMAFRSVPLHQKLMYLLPVSYALFSFQYWELSTWSMAALQNLYVVPFALFSLYSLTKSGQRAFVLACGAAILATYTSGNGLFSFVAGIPLLLLLKSYRKLAGWLFVGVLAVGGYFLNYVRPPYHPDIVDSLVNHTGRAVTYFFMLTGSLAGPGRPKIALLFGVGLLLLTLGLVAYLGYAKRLTAHLTLLSWLLFFYLTCLSLMASRSGLGEGQAFTPRYGIVVVMLFATQAVLAIETAPTGWMRLLVWAVYAGISVLFYLSPIDQGNRQRLVDRSRQLQYSTAFFNENPANLFLHWGNSGIAEPIFWEARKNEIFQVPDLTFHDLKSLPQPLYDKPSITTSQITSNLTPFNTANFLIFYRNWALWEGNSPKNLLIQVVAQSPTERYVFDTYKHVWDDTNDHTLGRSYTRPGFSCVVDKRTLKPGQYVLWLRLVNGSEVRYQPTAIILNV